MTIHLAWWEKGKQTSQPMCGARSTTRTKLTNQHEKITCSKCKAYTDRTGDGPESLKSLFRF